MAEESESGGKENIGKSFSKKLGPLPVWAWALIGGAAGYLYLRSRANSSANTGAPVVATPTSDGSGIGGGGGGGDIGTTPTPVVTTTPVTVTAPPTSLAGPWNGVQLGPNGENLSYPGSPGLLTGFTDYGVDLGKGGPTGQGPGVWTTFYKPQTAAAAVAPPVSFQNPIAAQSQNYQYNQLNSFRPAVPWNQVPYPVITFGR